MSDALADSLAPICQDAEILENRQITPVTWIMKIHAPDAAPRTGVWQRWGAGWVGQGRGTGA